MGTGATPRPPARAVAPDRPLEPGRRLGRYRLVGPLGGGCQAVVWRAEQVEPALGAVALKLLPPELTQDRRRRALLYREAVWGARLAHPSLLPVFEFGEDDGIAFLVTPLVDGSSLADVIRARREPPDAAYLRGVARALAQVARAVAAAHASRAAHRDVKPANILIERRGAGRAYLCDFGLAREVGAGADGEADLWAGSPQYMAPEKLLGLDADDLLGDVYALGVSLYEAVTLEPPIPIPDGLPRSRWRSFLAAHAPLPPGVLVPGLSERFESVILRALARDPARRYPSAADLAADLERLPEGLV